MNEAEFLARLRAVATDPAAGGLRDDVAQLAIGAPSRLILTHDTIVLGVHALPNDPPDSIGWKLAAVNLSDLAAKGARPVGCLMSYALSGDSAWDAAFIEGLNAALSEYGMPLLGGDTVSMPTGSARSFGLTAIGMATSATVPTRAGGRAGDRLFLTGPVGDAGAGLQLAQAGAHSPTALLDAYRRPQPRLEQGYALAGLAHAMMDVSDGLLLDAARMGEASGLVVHIDAVPLSATLKALRGDGVDSRLAAACAGDDYELLVAADADLAGSHGLLPVGWLGEGAGLSMTLDGVAVPLPDRLGFTHGTVN